MIKVKRLSKERKKRKTYRHRQQYGNWQREGGMGDGVEEGKWEINGDGKILDLRL